MEFKAVCQNGVGTWAARDGREENNGKWRRGSSFPSQPLRDVSQVEPLTIEIQRDMFCGVASMKSSDVACSSIG